MTGLAIFGFAEDAAPVRRLADRLGVSQGLVDVRTFPDGETLPTVATGGAGSVILYASLHQPNARMLPLLLTADAFRRAGVHRLVLVAPYLPYLRQDMVFRPGQALSRDVICGLLGEAFDRVVTVQAHLHRTASLAGALGVPADNLDIAGDLALMAAAGGRPLIIGPDSESRPWVEAAAARLDTDWTAFDKQRLGDRQVALTLDPGVRIDGRAVLLLDDICSSGGTLAQAAWQLREAGASSIDVAVAHALFDANAVDLLLSAGVGRILSSDSIPHPTNSLELAGILAATLQDEIPA